MNSESNFIIDKQIIDPELQQSHNNLSKEQRLNAQMLRVKVTLHLKKISQIWNMTEEQLYDFLGQYQTMPSSRINVQEMFQMDNIKLIKTHNKLYFGQIQNKKKHGCGIAIYKEGKIYEGDFFLNQKSGFGTQIYSNTNMYYGQFSQNKKHGQGTFYWFSLTQPNNKKVQEYHGNWWGGLPDGYGQHSKSNGDYYLGKFKNGLKHGQGVEYYSIGDNYKGQFTNGMPEGYGQYRWNNGSSYKGDFKQGCRNGYGIWQDPKQTGQVYKGHYILDKKHGYGIYDWANGYIYKGYFIDDVRFGEGQLSLNGEVEYSGYWENGEKVDEKSKPFSVEFQEKTQENFALIRDIPEKNRSNKYSESHSRATDKLIRTQREPLPNFQRKFSAEKNNLNDKEFQINFTHRQKPDQKKQRRGHQNCIPKQKIGRIPKAQWMKTK